MIPIAHLLDETGLTIRQEKKSFTKSINDVNDSGDAVRQLIAAEVSHAGPIGGKVTHVSPAPRSTMVEPVRAVAQYVFSNTENFVCMFVQ